MGPPGPPGSNAIPDIGGGGLLKFSGQVQTQETGAPPPSYLADGGLFEPAPLLVAVEYAMPVARTLENFAVLVTASGPGAFPEPVTFDFLVDGAPVFTSIATGPGVAPVDVGVVIVNAGSTVSVRATQASAANFGITIAATATTGVS